MQVPAVQQVEAAIGENNLLSACSRLDGDSLSSSRFGFPARNGSMSNAEQLEVP
jgi:hypothetical protein